MEYSLDATTLANAVLPSGVSLRREYLLEGGRVVALDACAVQGRRPYMEDRWAVSVNSVEGTTGERTGESAAFGTAGAWEGPLLLGIFDGHGGTRVSDYLAAHLCQRCSEALLKAGSDEEAQNAALTAAFYEADATVVAEDRAWAESTGAPRTGRHPGPGATAVVAGLLPTTQTLLLAVVGDARAAVASVDGNVLLVTEDQTPSVAEEAARVVALGGTVTRGAALFDTRLRVGGVLAISRAFGNAGMKPYVTAEPVISRVQLPQDGCTLLMGSDGIFDVLTTQEAVLTACRPRERHPAGAVVHKARNLPGAVDNITCVTLSIGPAPNSQQPSATIISDIELFATPPTQSQMPITQDDRLSSSALLVVPPVEAKPVSPGVVLGSKRRLDDMNVAVSQVPSLMAPLVEPAST